VRSLCFDARWIYSGIGTYTLNLLKELSRVHELEFHAVTLSEHKAALEPFCDSLSVVDVPIYSVREQFSVARAARTFPVLHVPHYNAPLLRSGAMLVTIHDLTHVLDARFRNTMKSRVYAGPMLRMAAGKADHIFTVSEYSKRQIVEHLDVPAEKVTVTYNGVGPQFFPEPHVTAMQTVQRECGVTRPYVLYVGNLKPHKNIDGLLRAFVLVWSRTAGNCELLIVGDDTSEGAALRQLATDLGVRDAVRFAGNVSDDVLRSAYSAAEVTVLPSFEEGFGLPVVESMACGTPVTCSRAASLPEVAGVAAEYFEPHDVESIAAVMERLLQSQEDRARLRRLGFSNARRFTWAACAERHLSIYRQFCFSETTRKTEHILA
jgi:glycosyltransferase involved in cell wall biosynthesis